MTGETHVLNRRFGIGINHHDTMQLAGEDTDVARHTLEKLSDLLLGWTMQVETILLLPFDERGLPSGGDGRIPKGMPFKRPVQWSHLKRLRLDPGTVLEDINTSLNAWVVLGRGTDSDVQRTNLAPPIQELLGCLVHPTSRKAKAQSQFYHQWD